MSTSGPIQTGSLLADRFRVVEVLAGEGSGTVYRATDARAEREVALRLIPVPATAEERERGTRQGKIAARLLHPNIARTLDFGVDAAAGVQYVAADIGPGGTLAALLALRGAPPLPLALRIVEEAAAGLASAHIAGAVHGDVHPGMLWLARNEGKLRAVLVGLGIDPGTTTPGRATAKYCAPERLRRSSLTPAADVFSLGVIAYEVLAGLPADWTTTLLAMAKGGARSVAPPSAARPEIPRHVGDAIVRALAADPAQRWANAGEFAGALAVPAPAAEEAPAARPRIHLSTPIVAAPVVAPTLEAAPAPTAPQAAPIIEATPVAEAEPVIDVAAIMKAAQDVEAEPVVEVPPAVEPALNAEVAPPAHAGPFVEVAPLAEAALTADDPRVVEAAEVGEQPVVEDLPFIETAPAVAPAPLHDDPPVLKAAEVDEEPVADELPIIEAATGELAAPAPDPVVPPQAPARQVMAVGAKRASGERPEVRTAPAPAATPAPPRKHQLTASSTDLADILYIPPTFGQQRASAAPPTANAPVQAPVTATASPIASAPAPAAPSSSASPAAPAASVSAPPPERAPAPAKAESAPVVARDETATALAPSTMADVLPPFIAPAPARATETAKPAAATPVELDPDATMEARIQPSAPASSSSVSADERTAVLAIPTESGTQPVDVAPSITLVPRGAPATAEDVTQPAAPVAVLPMRKSGLSRLGAQPRKSHTGLIAAGIVLVLAAGGAVAAKSALGGGTRTPVATQRIASAPQLADAPAAAQPSAPEPTATADVPTAPPADEAPKSAAEQKRAADEKRKQDDLRREQQRRADSLRAARLAVRNQPAAPAVLAAAPAVAAERPAPAPEQRAATPAPVPAAAPPAATPAPTVARVDPSRVYSGSEVDQRPALRNRADLQRAVSRSYPTALLNSGTGGNAVVQFVVLPDGRVDRSSVRVVQASTPAFRSAAVSAIAAARFEPARVDGQPVRAEVSIPLTWNPE